MYGTDGEMETVSVLFRWLYILQKWVRVEQLRVICNITMAVKWRRSHERTVWGNAIYPVRLLATELEG